MWTRTSLVLLATFVVSGFSFPRPDEGEYKIPSVGTGQRSQYYVLHSDGTFKYGLDTGDGAFESVKSRTVGNRDGKFGYVDPDGRPIRLEYEAGEGGFVARGDHLPKTSPEFAQALADAQRRSEPFVDPLASEDSDASYGFQFQSEDHSRDEQSDADGTVRGSYSYVDENGLRRTYNYRAGGGIGFVIEGDGIGEDSKTTAPRKPQTQRRPQALYTTPTRRAQTPTRAFKTSSPVSPTHSVRVQPADVTLTRSQIPGDASYSFSFDAGDHSRSETSDPNLNIDGKFSFVADDGQQRTVTYEAGSSTGFVADGDHLPKISDHSSLTQTTRDQLRKTASHSTSIGHSGQSYLPPSSPFTSSRPFEEANIRSNFSPEGPYSFSYETSSHSRSESGDEQNNVVGDFSFVADDDGQRRDVKYEAGSSTGFIAEGAHIPVGPIVPGAPSGQPTGRIVPVDSVPFEDPLADADSDASYNFEFESDSYSRKETADKDGNVVGTYTIVGEDGVRRTYNFKSGEGIGFETSEVSSAQGQATKRPTAPTGQTLFKTHASGAPFTPTIPQHSRTAFSQRTKTTHSQSTPSAASIGSYLPPTHSFSSPKSQSVSDFTLHTYDASPGAEKFGYVLKFN